MADEPVTEEAQGTPRRLGVDERNRPILDIVGDQAVGRTSPSELGGGQFQTVTQQVQPEELLDVSQKIVTTNLDDQPALVQAPTVDSETGEISTITPQISIPSTKDVSISAENLPNTQSKIPAAVNVQGQVSNQSQVNELNVQDSRTKEQLLSAGSLAQAQTQELSEKATVQYQVEKLYESLEEGKPLPAWASANVRKVQDIMNARGLGTSSVAAAAMVQAIAESALPIAVQDANRFATIQLQNLNNEQQTALANAATLAAMDARNLDNKMKAAQQNAQSFLQMDLANANNEQASNILKYQSEVQSLFTDAAAENARLQFNAKSEAQVNQFYDQLGVTISKSNIDREVATNQFNVDQSNSMAKYFAKIEDSREKFNAQMQQQIDQSNILWRRTINTENTVNQNEQNKINAAALLGLTTTAQNNLWQKYRDEASFVFSSSQNELQRTHQLAQMAIANQFARDMFNARIDAETNQSIGRFLGETLKGVFSRASNSLASNKGSDIGSLLNMGIDPFETGVADNV